MEWAVETKAAVDALPDSGRREQGDSSLGRSRSHPRPLRKGHLAEKEAAWGELLLRRAL